MRTGATPVDKLRRLAGVAEGAPEAESPAAGESSQLVKLFFLRGVNPGEIRSLALQMAAAAAGSCLAALILHSVLPLAPAIAAPALLYVRLRKKAFQRADAFEKDLPAFLLSLASAVRTGQDPLAALLQSEKLFDRGAILRSELLRVKEAVEQGASEEDALSLFGRSVEHPDAPLFRTAFILARREGSSLAACLQRLTKVTRQRQSFRRKTKASLAMQKLSCFGIGACTVVIGTIQMIASPTSFQAAFSSSAGFKCLCVGLGLICFGLAWMMKLTRARI